MKIFFTVFLLIGFVSNVEAAWWVLQNLDTKLSCLESHNLNCTSALEMFNRGGNPDSCSKCSITYSDNGDSCLIHCEVKSKTPYGSVECISILAKTKDICIASVKNQKFLEKIKGTEYLSRLESKKEWK